MCVCVSVLQADAELLKLSTDKTLFDDEGFAPFATKFKDSQVCVCLLLGISILCRLRAAPDPARCHVTRMPLQARVLHHVCVSRWVFSPCLASSERAQALNRVCAALQDEFFKSYAAAHKKLSELGSKFEPEAGIKI